MTLAVAVTVGIVPSLLEALASDVAAGRLSGWALDEAVRLAREIVAEDDRE